jgi:uncharacterized protein YfiM (DUF2279 family)
MKRIIASILALSATLAHADEWTGKDKQMHFATSVVWGAGARLMFPSLNDWQATAVGTIPGLVKEIQDATRRNGSGWSNKDLVWDIAGAYVGVKITGLIVSKRDDTVTVAYKAEF